MLNDGEDADERLKQNIVEDVDLRVKEREVTVRIQSAVYLPLKLLARTEQAVREAYALRSVRVEPRYELELLERMDYSDVTGLLSAFYPPAPAVLAGCVWETEGTTLHARLRGNGLAELRPHLRADANRPDRLGKPGGGSPEGLPKAPDRRGHGLCGQRPRRGPGGRRGRGRRRRLRRPLRQGRAQRAAALRRIIARSASLRRRPVARAICPPSNSKIISYE